MTPRWMALLAAAAMVAAGTSTADATTLRCEPHTKMVCRDTGCESLDLTPTYSLVDLKAKTYTLCDSKGCDTYPVELSGSGQYGNLQVPGQSVLHKLNIQDGSFVQVATLLLDVFISYGTCRMVDVAP